MNTLTEGFEGQKEVKDRVTLWIALVCTFTHPQNTYMGGVGVFDKYFYTGLM
jgi:hypothetical protein